MKDAVALAGLRIRRGCPSITGQLVPEEEAPGRAGLGIGLAAVEIDVVDVVGAAEPVHRHDGRLGHVHAQQIRQALRQDLLDERGVEEVVLRDRSLVHPGGGRIETASERGIESRIEVAEVVDRLDGRERHRRLALKDRDRCLRKGDLAEKRKQQIVEPRWGGDGVVTEVESLADERLSASVRLGNTIPRRELWQELDHPLRIDEPAEPDQNDVHIDVFLNLEIRPRREVRERRQGAGDGGSNTEQRSRYYGQQDKKCTTLEHGWLLPEPS